MRSLLILFILACASLTMQAQTVEGIYTNKWESPSGEAISYDLTLFADGTFKFISTRCFLKSKPDKKTEAEGTWKLKDRLLLLTTIEDTNKLATDLNKNKARYVSMSPRNPNFNLIKPSLKFYESNVFYSKNMELIKTETSVTAVTE